MVAEVTDDGELTAVERRVAEPVDAVDVVSATSRSCDPGS